MPAQLRAEPRVALVIANGHYEHADVLRNPTNDADIIVTALLNSGFGKDDVIRLDDASKTTMADALASFRHRALGAEVALIYYAGHGMEVGGHNYLLPTDVVLAKDTDIDAEALELDRLIDSMEPARLRLVILDACRDNPLNAAMKQRLRLRVVGQGLAEVEPGADTLVFYSTRAGSVALDGDGDNSPFAQSLARRLAQPGLEIGLMFRILRDDVLEATGRQQEPSQFGALPGREFYLIPGSTGRSAEDNALIEALIWQGALSNQTRGGFQSYLNRYPEGQFRDLAQAKLRKLREKPARPLQQIANVEPLRTNKAAKGSRSARVLSASYLKNVAPICRSRTQDRYPFFGQSTAFIFPADFVELFGTNGVIEMFTNRELLPLIDTNGEFWSWRGDKPVTRSFDPDVPREFQKAAAIRDLLTEGFTMSGAVQSFGDGVDTAELEIADDAFRFDGKHRGPVPIVWPIAGEARVKWTLYHDGNVISRTEYEGPFAFLEWVNGSRLQNMGDQSLRATFGQGANTIALKLDLPTGRNPFARGGFWSFRCPEKL